jgi:predicted methyltransferase
MDIVHRTASLIGGIMAAAGCASNSNTESPAPAQEEHAHGQHHGTKHDHEGGPTHGMRHDFSDPERWSAVFDDPERDAWQKPAEIVAVARIAPGMVVADIGAGTGYLEPHLSSAVGASGKVLALDVEPALVEHMNLRFRQAKLDNVEARLSAPDDPGLDAGAIERVLIVNVWHHIDDRPEYAAKLHESLAPGGEVVIVDYTLESPHGPPAHHRLTPEQVIAELERGGLSARLADESLPYQYIVIATRP